MCRHSNCATSLLCTFEAEFPASPPRPPPSFSGGILHVKDKAVIALQRMTPTSKVH